MSRHPTADLVVRAARTAATRYSSHPLANEVLRLCVVVGELQEMLVRGPVKVTAFSLQNFSGTVCRQCGTMMQPSGSCEVCPGCGETSGGCG